MSSGQKSMVFISPFAILPGLRLCKYMKCLFLFSLYFVVFS